MVSDKIKTLRKEHKLTQEELAQKIYVSRQTISRWESGQAIPTTENIAQIAQYFEKDMRYFLPSYENISENTNEPLNETFFDKIKAFVHVYWKDICIFGLALTPLVHILFTPVSAYSYIYARKNNKIPFLISNACSYKKEFHLRNSSAERGQHRWQNTIASAHPCGAFVIE